MLQNILDLVFVGGMVAAFYFYIHAPRKKRKQKHSVNKIDLSENNKMKDLDFYGVNKMDADKEKFMQEVRNKKTKMENGEEISVDAAQAFALIRNSKYNDLIVSENGKINMKKILTDKELEIMKNKIQNFKVDPNAKRVEFKVPGYVQKVENINADDAQILEQEITIPNFDQLLEQEVKNVEEKNKSKLNIDENEINFETEKVEEVKVEKSDLNPVEKDDEISIPNFEQILNQEAENKLNIVENKNNFEVENEIEKVEKIKAEKSVLNPVEKDEEISIPNFEQILNQEAENKLNIVENQNTIDFENINYFSAEMFRPYADRNPYFFQAILKKLFSKNAANFLFLDFEKRNIYIEKNYFAKTVKTFFDYNGKIKFDQDFVKEDCADIYDGNKINDLIRDVSTEKTSEAFGSRNGMKFLYNLLLESQDVADLCISGWFLKFKFENIVEKSKKFEGVLLNMWF